MKINNLFYVLLIAYFSFGCQLKEAEDSSLKTSSENKTAMILGVYHFNNPGKDSHNMEVDDYLSDKRQREIEEVVRLLKEYKPTKIFVEQSSSNQKQIDSLYQLYLNDQLNLSEINGGVNEVYQIGFRLGKELDGIKIVAADHHGNWLGPYADFIADTLVMADYNENKAKKAEQIKDQQELFSSNTVTENLIHMNEWENILKNHHYYNNVAVPVKDTAGIVFSYQEIQKEIDGLPYQLRSFDFNNIGVELVAEWYKRNLFIYRNIIEKTQSNDRVLIIFGSGHVRYLSQLFGDNPEFDLVNPNEYLKKK